MKAYFALILCVLISSIAFAQRKRAAQPGFTSFVIAYPNTRTIERKQIVQAQAEVKNNTLNVVFVLDDEAMLQLNNISLSLINDTMLHTTEVKIVWIGQETTMVSDRPVKLTIKKLDADANKQIRVHAIGRVADKKGRQTFEMQFVGALPAYESIKEYQSDIKE